MNGRAVGRRLTAAVLIAAFAIGCNDSNVASVAPTRTATPDPTPVSKTYELGTKVWYQGLILTFDRVTSLLDQRGGTVELVLAIANPNVDDSNLNAGVTLAIGDARIEPTRESKVPALPGSGSVATVLTFEVQSIESVDDAAFEVGGAPDHVARVPITPAAGDRLTYEPIPLQLKGTGQASTLKITLKSGLLRWDLPDWAQELTSRLQVLTLTYDVTYVGDFGGGLAFTGANVALRLPDGTVISARRDGHSQSVELVGSHKTKKGLFSRFEIPSGMTGKFALLVRTPGFEKSISFSIGG